MTKLPLHLESLSKADLEGMCVDCGLCCHAAIPVAKGVNAIVPELHCKHLKRDDMGKSCCSVYDTRLEVAKGWCFPLAEAIQKGLFPDQCPYVREMKDYVGTTVLDDRSYEVIRPQVQKAVLEKGMPPWVAESVWKSFTEGTR